MLYGVALVPVVIWRQMLAVIWGATPSSAATDVLTWPLLGIVDAFRSILFGDYVVATGAKGAVMRAYAFRQHCVPRWLLSVGREPLLWRPQGAGRRLAATDPALMSVLGVNGPWIEPIGFFRAFTECWVVGCLLLDTRFAQSRLALPSLATLVVIWIGAAWQTTSAIN